jgi:two-component system sensor histidine kinase DegS
VQEALNNFFKHAESNHVNVIVEQRGGELTALVEDNRHGFDLERVGMCSERQSFGLLGMRERVGLMGGSLVVESKEGEGPSVRARIPLTRPLGEACHGG